MTKAHHNPQGGFINPWPSFTKHGVWKFMTALFSEYDTSVKAPSKEVCDSLVQDVDLELIKKPVDSGARLTWLGHASFLLQLSDCNLLFDPIFSQRCSINQWIGPKRYTRPPCTLEQLCESVNVDAIIISHNQYNFSFWFI
jgi:N-acyl-phosphatidylethanolamine-hydrolysing phospholipase D